MNSNTNNVTFCDVLNNDEAKEIVETMEDMMSSTDGETRYAKEIADCKRQIETLTGFKFND